MKNQVMYVFLSFFVLSVVLSFLLYVHVFSSVVFPGVFYMSALSFLSSISAFLRICRWFVFLSFDTVLVYFFLESLLCSFLSFLTLLMSFFLCFPSAVLPLFPVLSLCSFLSFFVHY